MIDFRREVARRWPAAKHERRALVLDCPELRAITTMPPPYRRITVSWGEMMAAVPHEPPSSVAIIQAVEGGVPEPRVRDLVAAAGLVPVVPVVPLEGPNAAALATLFDWGVADTADARFELRPAALAHRLNTVHAMRFKLRLEPHLSRFVSMEALTLIRAAAGVVVDRGAAPDLAGCFEVGERTVAGWCARASIPPPRRLFAWLRLLLSLALLDTPGRTLTDAARCAGYRDHSLRRSARELLGVTTRLAGGMFADAATAFNGELRELRERARDVRRGKRAE
ncbi:MAG TPA: hypothetical protein VFJ82_13550 [Longimicrobium sp.]|nr:hypothetical protein [Longimicrobium sp.]